MENLRPWFILKTVPGIGNLRMKRLLDLFQTPERVLSASISELVRTEGISRRLARAIHQHRLPSWVEDDLNRVAQTGYRIVTLADAEYPSLLLQIPDPPPFLYVYGNLCSTPKNIAVVGSRNATGYGLSIARKLCADISTLGLTIVSGMARGIDTAAHLGALSANGKTVAVLGSGLEKVYPAENKGLFHKIAASGAVISEFPLTAPPEGHNFPIRNRIISGMSLGTVVVEAGMRSGSLITARLAAEQNREVFAVPGSISSYKSTGTHNLIKQGAKLVEHAQDIIEELTMLLKGYDACEKTDLKALKDRLPPLTADESLVLAALGPYPVHIDDLARQITLDIGKLSAILLQLELKGVVTQTPGKMFSMELQS